MDNCTGMIFNVQRFSLHDGPGIRTTVFFKGCNLRCKWCHNPESFSGQPQLLFYKSRCTNCGKCSEICSNGAAFDRSLCKQCHNCVGVCLNDAREVSGSKWDSNKLIELILRDKDYYDNTNGGVTFSGGEPLLQADFLHELLMRCKENGIHTVVETACNVDKSVFLPLIPLVDLWKVDLKLYDAARHEDATGVTNEKILENISFLAEHCSQLEINIPIIPKINNDEYNLEKTAIFLSKLTTKGQITVCLLSFHKLAEDKYDRLQVEYTAANYQIEDKSLIDNYSKYFTAHGLLVK